MTCGHELSHKLNARLRATTTILNAHLIPIIRDLLQSVRKVLDGFSIQAPLMVVKGDGSLFREEVCLSRPVETILSGPAASVVGASSLLGHLKDEVVVIDIGGTTSDIAILQGGYPKLNRNGVAIGPWQTHVTAVDVRTVGLGGDSHVRKNHYGEILIGARRVEPLCFLAKRFAGVIHQMRSLHSQPVNDSRFTPIAFWFRTDKEKPPNLTDRVEKILKALSEGPLNIFEMAKELDEYPIALRDELTDLEHQGMLRMAGFTPTDIFHIRNLYDPGVRECSLMAAQFLAKQMGMDMETLLLTIDEIPTYWFLPWRDEWRPSGLFPSMRKWPTLLEPLWGRFSSMNKFSSDLCPSPATYVSPQRENLSPPPLRGQLRRRMVSSKTISAQRFDALAEME
jgi:N-methylhydantoinase A/oxoprolinase/acetone carboxylase beta subunit